MEKSSAKVANDMLKVAEQPLTVLFHDLPLWMQGDPFIRRGYRPESRSYYSSIKSIGYLHNESINIWTHLFGSICFCVGSFFLWPSLSSRYADANYNDLAVFSCFFTGAVACLGLSATFHTLNNHSQAVARFSNRLDYLGIVFLIWGSFIPSIYYGFHCSPTLQQTYWTMISSIGVGCAAVCCLEKLQGPEFHVFRASMFVAMGLSAVFPACHGLYLYGIDRMNNLIGLPWLVLQGALYILGAFIYSVRVPEKWHSETFDIIGSSHQIFHVLVLLAAFSHLTGLLKAFDYHHSNPFTRCL